MNTSLCKNLKFSVELDAPQRMVKIKLADPLNMKETELAYVIGATTPESEGYHIREAIIIALRRLVHQAVDDGLIKIPARLPNKDTVVTAAKLTAVPPVSPLGSGPGTVPTSLR